MMQVMKLFSTLFLIGVIFVSTAFIYGTSYGVCRYPIYYRIGNIDEGFSITKEEAEQVTEEATARWEEALGEDIFIYDDNSDFTVNFVYDERQARNEAENGFLEKLENAENANEQIKEQYNSLVTQYEKLQSEYDTEKSAFETRLDNYNQKVNRYNREGGAPADVYTELEQERVAINKQQTSLNKRADELSGLVADINTVSQKGNLLIDQYNKGAERFNQTFGESRQFTQGDYQGDKINIYTFEDEDELRLVLAHEFGHALDIAHVEGEESVMYYLIGAQSRELVLTEEDKSALRAQCSDKSWWENFSDKVSSRFGA